MFEKKITSIKNVYSIINDDSNVDGENSWFELKGSAGSSNFTNSIKKILAKEISAFANTNGGILCFHKGTGTDLAFFNDLEKGDLFARIETWLRDCLSPTLSGMKLYFIEGVFIIEIPESEYKPHLEIYGEEYYLRVNTIATKMGKDIVNYYKNGDRLEYFVDLKLSLCNVDKLSFCIKLIYKSGVSGTNPKVNISFHGIANGIVGVLDNENFYIKEKTSIELPRSSHTLNLPFNIHGVTNNDFGKQILYPDSNIEVSDFISVSDDMDLDLIIVSVLINFNECKPKRISYLFKKLGNAFKLIDNTITGSSEEGLFYNYKVLKGEFEPLNKM